MNNATTTFGDIFESFQYGYTTSADTGKLGVRFVRITDISDGEVDWESVPGCEIDATNMDIYLLSKDDFLFARTGSIEKACWIKSPPQSIFASYLIRARLKDPSLAPWVAHFIKSLNYLSQVHTLASGTGRQNINATNLKKIKIPIPPNDLRTKSVAKLDLLSSHTKRANDYLSTIPTLTERFRQSVLARAFTGELTADWRRNHPDVEPASELLARIKVERRQKWVDTYARNLADRARKNSEKKGKPFSDADWQAYYDKKLKAGEKKYEEPQPVDAEKEGLPEIPESWEWVRVSTLGDVQLGRQRSPKYHSGPNMVPYLRVANVFENRIDTTDVMEMHFDESDLEQYKLHAGDILLNEGQSAELVGRPAIYNNELPVACFTNTLVRYRVYEGVSKDFALMIFRGYLYTGKFKAIAKITTNIAHLGAGRFADMPFPLPPAEEQQEIARRVSDLLNLLITFEAQTDLATQQLDRLKSSTLSAMLSGDE